MTPYAVVWRNRKYKSRYTGPGSNGLHEVRFGTLNGARAYAKERAYRGAEYMVLWYKEGSEKPIIMDTNRRVKK